jgi:hypothetical protein
MTALDSDDFLKFRWLLTPRLISWLYVIGAVLGGLIILAFGDLFGRDFASTVSGTMTFLSLVVFELGWRIYCEYLIILFRIHDSLVSIDAKTIVSGRLPVSGPAAPPAIETAKPAVKGEEPAEPPAYCWNCGKKLTAPNATFCGYCGAKQKQ